MVDSSDLMGTILHSPSPVYPMRWAEEVVKKLVMKYPRVYKLFSRLSGIDRRDLMFLLAYNAAEWAQCRAIMHRLHAIYGDDPPEEFYDAEARQMLSRKSVV